MAENNSAKKSSDLKSGTLTCTSNDLAEMLGLTVQQIYNLEKDGIAVKLSRGKFDCTKSVANYIKRMRELDEQRKQTPEKIQQAMDLYKLRGEQWKSRKVELQVLQIEGKMHYEEDVKELWNNQVIAAKSKLIALGVKIAPQIAGETEVAIIQSVIDREVRDTLNELSNYDASKYQTDFAAALREDGEEENGK